MASTVWSPDALNDLKTIHDFIALRSDHYADKMISRILDRPKMLLLQPSSGRIVPEFRMPEIRAVFEGSYRIIYTTDILPDIYIARVYHFAQLLKKL